MPPGAVSLEDVDLDQVSVDYVVNCAKKGTMLELSEAIRDYHDHTELPHMNNTGSADGIFLVTAPESSGSPPKRAPPAIPSFTNSAHFPPVSKPTPVYTPPPVYTPSLVESTVSESESFSSMQVQELTVDVIEDFEDDDMLETVDSARLVQRNPNDAADFALALPSFSTGITEDDLRQTAYEVLLACAAASGGLIVPSIEKKKERKSKLIRKLGRSRNETVASQSQRAGNHASTVGDI